MRRIPGSRRIPSAAANPGEGTKLLVIAALALTLIATVAGKIWLPQHHLAALVATALFASAAVAALAGWRWRSRAGARLGWLDLAGIMTGIGIVLSLLIEPEQAVQFVEEATRGK